MNNRERKKMIATLNSIIEQQTHCLEDLLLSKNAIEFKNDPYIPNDKEKYRSLESLSTSISNLLLSMEDVLAIRESLINKESEVSIRASREDRNKILNITSDYLVNAGLCYSLKGGILKFI